MINKLINKHFYLGKNIKEYMKNNPNDKYSKILFRKYKYELKDDIVYYFYEYSYNSYDVGYKDGIICYTIKETIDSCKVIKETKVGKENIK